MAAPSGATPLPLLPPEWERRMLRVAMGITVTAAARELGVHRMTYARWESGKTPSPDNQRAYHAQLERWDKALRSTEDWSAVLPRKLHPGG